MQQRKRKQRAMGEYAALEHLGAPWRFLPHSLATESTLLPQRRRGSEALHAGCVASTLLDEKLEADAQRLEEATIGGAATMPADKRVFTQAVKDAQLTDPELRRQCLSRLSDTRVRMDSLEELLQKKLADAAALGRKASHKAKAVGQAAAKPAAAAAVAAPAAGPSAAAGDGAHSEGQSASNGERPRSPTPVIIWRQPGKVRVASNLPAALKSVFSSAPAGRAGGEGNEALGAKHRQHRTHAAISQILDPTAALPTHRPAPKGRARVQYGLWFVPPSQWRVRRRGARHDKKGRGKSEQRSEMKGAGRRGAEEKGAAAGAEKGDEEEEGDEGNDDDDEDEAAAKRGRAGASSDGRGGDAFLARKAARLRAKIPTLFSARAYRTYLERTRAPRLPPYLAEADNLDELAAGDEVPPPRSAAAAEGGAQEAESATRVAAAGAPM
jgi:hypothetical protein